MANARLRLDELHTLVADILIAHDTARNNAERVARALVMAEADGQKGHGASRIPSTAPVRPPAPTRNPAQQMRKVETAR